MKKLLYVIPMLVIFGLASTVYAAPSPTGVQNKNQVQTQNAGEESQLQVNTQEQENLGVEREIGSRSGSLAGEHMSEVAKQVQALLEVRTTGGIGQQVREIAQAQNQAQIRIQTQLDKFESKGKLARFFTGTDYEAVKDLRQQIVENELRIEELTALKTQLTNQSDITMVEETIQALIQENISLESKIAEEMQTKSLFGWLARLFAQ